MPGAATSEVEVTNISQHGFWLLLDGRELFLPFKNFPWFKQATVEAILRLERPAPGHRGSDRLRCPSRWVAPDRIRVAKDCVWLKTPQLPSAECCMAIHHSRLSAS
jgi:hypothetical protein